MIGKKTLAVEHFASLETAKAAVGFPAHPPPHGLLCSFLPGCVRELLRPLSCAAAGGPRPMSWAINFSKTCSHTPCRFHRQNRVYTLFQGADRSGRSRQGILVFGQYKIPLSITRLPFSGGSTSFTLFHCSFVNLCRFVPLLYYFFSILCLKTFSGLNWEFGGQPRFVKFSLFLFLKHFTQI